MGAFVHPLEPSVPLLLCQFENETSIYGKAYGKLTAGRAADLRLKKRIISRPWAMNRSILGIIVAILVLLVAGVVFLGTYQQPPTTTRTEVPIPNDRLSLQ
jgi:hypothetical protein